MIIPSFLAQGDAIAIVAPAKAVDKAALSYAVALIEEKGYKVKLGENIFDVEHNMAGSDASRLSDINRFINDSDVKAILAFRGGYGSIRIIDDIDFNFLEKNPKWLIGFSDVTVFHNALNKLGLASLHATMPINFQINTKEAIDSLFNSLEGRENEYTIKSNFFNTKGHVEGELIGGNLAVLCSLIGTKYDVDYTGKILFIEDLSEYLYRLDRMMWSLKHSGKLSQIKGLIVGGFTQMQDGDISYGKSAYEIISEHTKDLGIPICYDFPVGHFEDNRAMECGIKASLFVNSEKTVFTQG